MVCRRLASAVVLSAGCMMATAGTSLPDEDMTMRRLTAIIEREGDGYVSLCPELDIASQGDTVEEARENLSEALELFFEVASPEEIGQRLKGEMYVTSVEIAVA